MVFLNHEAQLLRLAELRHRATAERARHASEPREAPEDRPGHGGRWGRAKPAEPTRERAGADGGAEDTDGPDSGRPLWSRRDGRSRRRRRWTKAV